MDFDVGKWFEHLLFIPEAYGELYFLATNPAAVEIYFATRAPLDDSLGESSHAKPFKPEFLESLHTDLGTAISLLSRQMVVIGATYTEGMISDFLSALFFKHPERMHQFLSGETDRIPPGYVPLREITESVSREELIKRLADRAASAAARGSFDSRVRRLGEVARLQIVPSMVEPLDQMFKLRNRIVHENAMPTIELAAVMAQFRVLDSFLIELGRAALNNGVPVRDPAHILDADNA
jgi:hypothetical protein